MRRGSLTNSSVGIFNNEPLIVVEESGQLDEDEFENYESSTNFCIDIDPSSNPYLLSPWNDPRDTRKHSLPTPQCTSGITASQVRRLSERGIDSSASGTREAAFLATLTQAPTPTSGGRRHSVVTISKVPPALFGRNRRESIAAFPGGSRVLGSRRESGSQGPPSTDPRGSIHNLELDRMDDIVQTRKARMKVWNTSSEKVCEVQTLDEVGNSSPLRYTNRRFSDFVGMSPLQLNRRVSDNPPVDTSSISDNLALSFTKVKIGVVCKNSAKKSLLSSLASSASEINKFEDPQLVIRTSIPSNLPDDQVAETTSHRSNSFDMSNLNTIVEASQTSDETALSGWYEDRHQPMSKKKSSKPQNIAVTFSKDVLDKYEDSEEGRKEKSNIIDLYGSPKGTKKTKTKVGNLDAHTIGSAIEGFLRRESSNKNVNKGAIPKKSNSKKSVSNTECLPPSTSKVLPSTSLSICNTLKDFFWTNSHKSGIG